MPADGTPEGAARRLWWGLALALVVAIVGHVVLDGVGIRSGFFYFSTDEPARLGYARDFALTGNFHTFDYTWLPLPIWVAGTLGQFMDGDFAAATLLINRCLGLATILCLTAAAWVVRPDRWTALLTVLLLLATPWQVLSGATAYAEPFAWFGMSLVGLGLAVGTLGRRALVAGLLMSGVGTGVACLSRYEAWLYAPGVVIAGAVLVGLDAIAEVGVGNRFRRIAWLLPVWVVASVLAVAPVVWWMSVHAEHFGDPLRPFALTHMFRQVGVGEASPNLTPLELYRWNIFQCFWVPVLALLAVLHRGWCLRFAAVAIPPLLHLAAILWFSRSGGIPWLAPERTLGFASLSLAVPAVIVMADWFRSGGRGVAFVYTLVLGTSLVMALTPPEGEFGDWRETNRNLRELMKRQPLARGEKIAVPPGDLYASRAALIWPETGRLVPTPAEWGEPGTAPSLPEIKRWLAENQCRLWISTWSPAPAGFHPEFKQIITPPLLPKRLEEIERRRLSLLVFTFGDVPMPFPPQLAELLTERGVKVPDSGDHYRYWAIVPLVGSSSPREFWPDATVPSRGASRSIYARPLEQRLGLPGNYLVRVEVTVPPTTTIAQVGRTVLHPRRTGLHVMAFEDATGRVIDLFRVESNGIHVEERKGSSLFIHVVEAQP